MLKAIRTNGIISTQKKSYIIIKILPDQDLRMTVFMVYKTAPANVSPNFQQNLPFKDGIED